MDGEFCATNGFAYFCRNKSKACGRQMQENLEVKYSPLRYRIPEKTEKH